MEDQKSYKFELLKFELDAIQKGIDTYNRAIFAVKGLAMTLFTTFIAFLGNKTGKPHLMVFIAMAGVLLLFWVLDAMFKSIQVVYISRGLEIEQEIRKPGFYQRLDEPDTGGPDFPGIEHAFASWKAKKGLPLLAEFFKPTVLILYIVLIALDLALARLLK